MFDTFVFPCTHNSLHFNIVLQLKTEYACYHFVVLLPFYMYAEFAANNHKYVSLANSVMYLAKQF